MNPNLAYLKLLLNDIHVDLGIFQNEMQHNHHIDSSSENFIRISDFKERVLNLKDANNKCQLDSIKKDIEQFVSGLQDNSDFLSYNKEKITQLREMAVILMTKISSHT